MRAGLSLAIVAWVGLIWPAQAQVSFWKYEWPDTDFTKTSVEFNEIIGGGPPKDGIPALNDPGLIPVDQENRLAPKEPVMVVALKGTIPRAYPIRYLMWHEIVNDRIDGIPVAVTFCPLCNSGIIFDRRVAERELQFGVSGKLRNSDMVMFDRQTESWWQQFTGEAIVGELLGTQLKKLPGWMESWASFQAHNPDGLVMDQPNASRNYGRNPYVGYDSLDRPFLYSGENPPHDIPPLARVVVVGARAWPLSRVRTQGPLSEAGLTISWQPGTASALDGANIGTSRDVGAVRVKDAKTGTDLAHDVSFAFAFHAFHPKGIWMIGQ